MRFTTKATSLVTLAAVLALLAILAVPMSAATITGTVFKPMWSDYTTGHEAVWKGFAGMGVSATREGGPQEVGAGAAETWAGEPVGHFDMQVLPGTYSIMFHEKDEYARHLMFGQVVPNTSPYTLTLFRTIKYQDSVTAFTWDPFPAGTWSQSFVAKGTSVVQVGLHQAIEFGPDVRVTITETDPTGPQIGPAKTIPTHVANPSSAYWSAGDVPTVPGRTYCVNFHVPGGLQAFLAGSRIQGGVAYPDGRTYRDEVPTTQGPVKCTIYQDTDGIISCVSTKKTNSASLPLAYASVTTAGQTFTAKGVNLLSFSVLVGNTAGKLLVDVYESPGPDGEGVNKVGLTKYMKTIEYNTRSGVVWKPGEVPIVEGNTYYIKLKRPDGQPFTIYYVNENEYLGGAFIMNGVPTNFDLSTTITTEAFHGSATMSQVKISNINVTRGINDATISWNTDVPTDTNYVEYGPVTPYTMKIDASSGGTSHSVTITGLQPNTQYHYRVVSKTAGYFDNYSRDFVFCTDPDSPNLLLNPGFEAASLSPWTAYQIYNTAPAVRDFPWTPSGNPSFFSIQAHGGNKFVGSATNGHKNKGGVYQRVPATVGKELHLRAWLCTYQTDPIGGMFQHNCIARVGIDPTGGTDPAAGSIVWGPWITAQDIMGAVEEGNGKGYWTEGYVAATALSENVTVFLEAGAEGDIRWTVWGVDDAVLTEAEAVDVEKISDLVNTPDGTLVRIPGKIVVAGESEVGANYVVEPDRSSGLRVESLDLFFRGYNVTIQGRKGVKPSGEIYLYDAVKMSEDPDTEPAAMSTVAKSINLNKLGPSNVGLLMQVTGKISVDGFFNFYINDGSLPGNGLKIRIDSLNMLPDVGMTYSIAGVVQMEGTGANATPLLCPRDDFDVVAR